MAVDQAADMNNRIFESAIRVFTRVMRPSIFCSNGANCQRIFTITGTRQSEHVVYKSLVQGAVTIDRATRVLLIVAGVLHKWLLLKSIVRAGNQRFISGVVTMG